MRQLTKLMKYKHAALFCTQERVDQGVMVLLEVSWLLSPDCFVADEVLCM